MKTKRIAFNAVFAAMAAVLGYLAIDLGSIKFTLESLPVIIGALLFGATDGAFIGGVGIFIYQLLRYGITLTTPLWILPFIVEGVVIGLYSKSKNYELSRLQTLLIIIIGELIVTGLNTLSLYIDSHIYGYYYPTFITASLAARIVICIVKACVYGAVLPALLRRLKTQLHK